MFVKSLNGNNCLWMWKMQLFQRLLLLGRWMVITQPPSQLFHHHLRNSLYLEFHIALSFDQHSCVFWYLREKDSIFLGGRLRKRIWSKLLGVECWPSKGFFTKYCYTTLSNSLSLVQLNTFAKTILVKLHFHWTWWECVASFRIIQSPQRLFLFAWWLLISRLATRDALRCMGRSGFFTGIVSLRVPADTHKYL